jgi:hypothetical protein
MLCVKTCAYVAFKFQGGKADMAKEIPLSEVLEEITNQLLQADAYARRRGKSVMQFQECEVEFAVELSKEGEGGVEIYVARIGGAVKKTDINTIKVKFAALPEYPTQAASRLESEEEPITKQPRTPSRRKE